MGKKTSNPASEKPKFLEPTLADLSAARMIKIRSGTVHKFTGVWVVVVRSRVFVRSWNDKPTGWYRAFCAEPSGSMEVRGQTIAVSAKTVRGERLIDTIDEAYARKYQTAADQKWVVGFRVKTRRATTTELLPLVESS
jgi:hypothetical protein